MTVTNTSVFSSVKPVKKEIPGAVKIAFSWDRIQSRLAELYRSFDRIQSRLAELYRSFDRIQSRLAELYRNFGKSYCRYYQKKKTVIFVTSSKFPFTVFPILISRTEGSQGESEATKIASFHVLQIHSS